ncbi:poly(ethylene terephthalate) hydrolase family protein [Pseudomonas mangrovi]|uniref:Alpha/beta hydrolase n=1 Tax=Pseudomonas mangrovi TaxID=2161748 RepID=A0A2T5P5J6_9PSED|nr:alpha/beta hydrolase [Pseudomonas mangrovi]PTU73011.1 alpha/beta hydrolase [Pseudomonas mangrovi]
MLKNLLPLSAVAFGLVLSNSAMALLPDTPGAAFPSVSNFANSGPYSTTNRSEGPSCQIYRPTTLGQNGVRHPVILWGNGTGGTPATYGALLTHWASHGFVVAAAQTTDAGTGVEMLACLSYLQSEAAKSSGTYVGKLNLGRVGTSGHSQGGGGSIMAGRDSRIKTTAPMQPYVLGLGHDTSSHRVQNGPMFQMSGSLDTLAIPSLNQQLVYNNINQPIFWGTLRGASHFVPVGDAGGFRGPATAWFRYQLMGDANAKKQFVGTLCGLCTSASWTNVKRKGTL